MKIEEAYNIWNKKNDKLFLENGKIIINTFGRDQILSATETIIADKDRQIDELKKDALEMAELVSIIHPLGHDRAQEIIEKYTKESEQTND